jgi:deazaflavin-dependent oxidoreductase (nitroreductase family)
MTKYQAPDWFTTRVANPAVALLTKRLGLSIAGSRVLAVRGRKSGAWRSTPVNVLTFQGQRYLVAPRGETQWARNIRASGGGELHLGSKVEPIRVTELGDDEKGPVLRAYLRRWKWEAGKFFAVSGPDATDEDLRRIAPDHPVFRIST